MEKLTTLVQKYTRKRSRNRLQYNNRGEFCGKARKPPWKASVFGHQKNLKIKILIAYNIPKVYSKKTAVKIDYNITTMGALFWATGGKKRKTPWEVSLWRSPKKRPQNHG